MSQNILVTGTNSGFGRLITHSLARAGHQVFATMRDVGGRNRAAAEEMRALAEKEGLKIHVVEMEVTSDAGVNEAIAGVLAKAGHLDVVVNNAGTSVMGLEETLTPDQIQAMFSLNVLGPHRVARAVLPSMRARGKGLLVQISSTLGRLVLPFMGAYCASKAALESLSESYRYELRPTGVELTLVQPGAFPTDFGKHAAVGAEQDRAKGYGPLENGFQQMMIGFGEMMSSPNAPNPQLVADAVVQLVSSPAGSRPDRVVVDPMMGQATEGLNKGHLEMQKAALGGMGMGNLVG
jgi:NAD(P)-dependent dehydrogenase (short-subunit alcohol dehydrogenase family)